MRVTTETFEYTLYIGADGIWTMHTWDPGAPTGEQWIDSTRGVNLVNPFLSSVDYDAWR